MAKKYPVVFSASAESDLHAIHDLIAQRRPRAADKWVEHIQRQVGLVATLPLAFEVVPEAEALHLHEYRHIIHVNYRTIYRVDESRVFIVRIVHGARILTRAMLGLEPEPEPERPA